MTEEQIADIALELFHNFIEKLPTNQDKTNGITALMLTATELLRMIEGDEFVRGWLESELKDIAKNTPDGEFSLPH